MTSEQQANLIKVGAVITAAPRWVSALIVSEGLTMPAEWLGWWRVLSFAMAAAMAFVEAFAFAYILRAWREARPDSAQAKRLMWLIVLSALCFIAVMAPNVYASAQGVPLASVLSGWPLAIWSVAVAASTILIVASVGYAQRRTPAAHMRQDALHDARIESHTCAHCDASFANSGRLAAHVRWTHPQPSKNGKQSEEVEAANRLA